MVEFGFSLSSEEHGSRALVEQARAAEEAGFSFAMISDHFHPWVERQGNSSFVWSVLGAIAASTERLRVGTGVTCPMIRIHPAIVAQAAATMETLMPGRFMLGLGTGENLNEHITGDRWPSATERRRMLEEAIEVIRELWNGELTDHHGEHYTVIDAKLYTLPEQPPPILVAASGQKSAELAGRLADGLVGTAPDEETLKAFDDAGGSGKPRYAQVTLCYARDERTAIDTVLEWWPQVGVGGEASQELPLPRMFESAAGVVKPGDVREAVACGPDVERHLEMIAPYLDAGYDHIYLHQIGPDQEGFLRFAREELLPRFEAPEVRKAG
jgi:coenzyme F420-dependent glucose-6-phosphate dehydrogenase